MRARLYKMNKNEKSFSDIFLNEEKIKLVADPRVNSLITVDSVMVVFLLFIGPFTLPQFWGYVWYDWTGFLVGRIIFYFEPYLIAFIYYVDFIRRCFQTEIFKKKRHVFLSLAPFFALAIISDIVAIYTTHPIMYEYGYAVDIHPIYWLAILLPAYVGYFIFAYFAFFKRFLKMYRRRKDIGLLCRTY